jgi:hypothetical protein
VTAHCKISQQCRFGFVGFIMGWSMHCIALTSGPSCFFMKRNQISFNQDFMLSESACLTKIKHNLFGPGVYRLPSAYEYWMLNNVRILGGRSGFIVSLATLAPVSLVRVRFQTIGPDKPVPYLSSLNDVVNKHFGRNYKNRGVTRHQKCTIRSTSNRRREKPANWHIKSEFR